MRAVHMVLMMGWQMFWALSLGFLLSGIIEAVVSKEKISRLLPDSSAKSVLTATALGAASSSCSYAAAALGRSLFKKGADFIASMAFMFASTNLVLELSILLAVLMGWQFVAAEFLGGPLMIVVLVVLLRVVLRPRLLAQARKQASENLPGKMEGHAAMDMSLHEGSFVQKVTSAKGLTAIAHYYFMNWYSLWFDIALGLVLSGVMAAVIPNGFWKGVFLESHPVLSKLWGPLVGPLVAVVTFVCSVGNVPMAAVLWGGGISFGGVLAFLFADLIIVPLLNIYRKYYGAKVAAVLFFVFYTAMALASLAVELIFNALHLVPQQRNVSMLNMAIRWNYTSWLDVAFGALSLLLLVRFLRTGGPAMLKAMGEAPADDQHGHHHCH